MEGEQFTVGTVVDGGFLSYIVSTCVCVTCALRIVCFTLICFAFISWCHLSGLLGYMPVL